MPYLTGQSGTYAGQRIEIPASGLSVGRVPQGNHIVIEDPEVSRHHARIAAIVGGEAEVEDLSANGIQVNGQRVRQRARLRAGDIVSFGGHPAQSFVYGPAAAPVAGAGVSGRAAGAAAAPGTIQLAPAAAAESRCWLQLVVGQRSLRTVPLPGRLALGREGGPGRLAIPHASVSANHAEIRLTSEGRATLRDLGSTNGTFVNAERVDPQAAGVELQEGDLIQLGACDSHLLLFRESERRPQRLRDLDVSRPLVRLGRGEGNDIRLDHPSVSLFHAELRSRGGTATLVDLGSTNGTFVNGTLVSRPQTLAAGDRVALGALQFVYDGGHFEGSAAGARASLSAFNLRVEVRDRATGKTKRLLDDISMAVETGQFVGLLGGSGAGKSTLMDALNGARPAQQGQVLINHADLYREFAALRSLIGYVPQDDILHSTLTGRECLYYSARLRLPDDFGESALRQRVAEVVEVLELKEQADQPIRSLSGGQRKRVSVGIELLSNPSILFLDEPTAGQDPKNEQQMMQLFRRLANRGACVIINTHLLGSFGLLDRVAVLVAGKMAYYGPAQDMLGYFDCEQPHEVYYRLKDGETPEAWARRFRSSEIFQEYVGPQAELPAATSAAAAPAAAPPARRSALRQAATLLSRQVALKLKDKAGLGVLVLPPSIIAALIGLMDWPVANSAGRVTFSPNSPLTLFIMVLIALWFGCSATVRELVDEAPIYRRERQRDLKLSSYLACKLIYLLGLAGVQSGLFILVMAAMHVLAFHLLMAWALMWLLMVQGGLIGYLISAVADSAEKALYAFPLIMIAELLFAGMLVPTAPLRPIYAQASYDAQGQVRNLGVFPQPAWLPTMAPMSTPLRDSVAAVMVSRWSLEALASLYTADLARLPDCFAAQSYASTPVNCGYPLALLDTVALTLDPHAAARASTYITSLAAALSQGNPAAAPPPPAQGALLARYGLIEALFALIMVGLIVVAMKRKEA